jgi:hypothetical protein
LSTTSSSSSSLTIFDVVAVWMSIVTSTLNPTRRLDITWFGKFPMDPHNVPLSLERFLQWSLCGHYATIKPLTGCLKLCVPFSLSLFPFCRSSELMKHPGCKLQRLPFFQPECPVFLPVIVLFSATVSASRSFGTRGGNLALTRMLIPLVVRAGSG